MHNAAIYKNVFTLIPS